MWFFYIKKCDIFSIDEKKESYYKVMEQNKSVFLLTPIRWISEEKKCLQHVNVK